MYRMFFGSAKRIFSLGYKRYRSFLFLLVTATIINSCYYNNEEDLFGEVPDNCPDPTIITYSEGVQPILSANCYVCHSNPESSSFGGGVRLQDYADVKIRATNGTLLGTITHSSGFPAMPQGGQKLEDCNILIIRKWIEAGSLNN